MVFIFSSNAISFPNKKVSPFWPRHSVCGVFSSQPGIGPMPPAVEATEP